MKLLNTATADSFSAAGLQGARQFGFEMNSIAFHAVIDGIYSNKVEAPVREYATNAYDAHRMVGKGDVPFILMAPSTFNPYFMVRDFGPGMDHDEVMERATTLFGSNKRDSNDQVGMLGLGMKSAFAYTKQYTITCFDGARKREYVCFLDAGGAPTVSLAAEGECSEPRGVMVKFPVQQADIYRFRAAIERVMIGFDPMPEILNDQWKPSSPVSLMQGENYRIVKSDQIKRPHIRQGCVLYPLDLSQILEAHEFTYKEQQLPVIIDVPIGTASVSTSREQLGYDEPTKDNLRKAWLETRAQIKAELQATFDEPDSFLDACIRYRELSSSLGDVVPDPMMWRSRFKLRKHFPYIGSTGATVRVDVVRAHAELEWSPPRQPRGWRRYQEAPKLTPEDLKSLTICWEAEDCKFAKDRLRMFRSKNPDVNVLWVKTENMEDFTAIYGIETFVDLRDYERLRLPRSTAPRRALTKQDIRQFDRYRNIVPEPEKAVYIPSEGSRYQVLGEVLDYDVVHRRYITLLEKLGVIDGRRVIVLMKNQRNLPKERPDWVHLDDLLRQTASSFDLKTYMAKQDVGRFVREPLVQRLSQRVDSLPKRLRDLISKAAEYEPVTHAEPILANLWQTVTGKELPAVKTTFQDRFQKLIARYPLLHVVQHNEEHLDHYLKLIAR